MARTLSFAALAWASKCPIPKASDKLILLGFADRHSEETGNAYPSVQWLCEFSSLDRKTVIAAIARLVLCEALKDTGSRQGRTSQVKVYSVAVGTVPKTELYHKRNGSVFPRKESQKRDTDTIKEPSVANATGSADPIKELFDMGVALLIASGLTEKNSRSLIGKWRKGKSDGEVLTGFIECKARAISAPVEWLEKRFKSARRVSASGYEYRGSDANILREAERRADWGTYYEIKGEASAH